MSASPFSTARFHGAEDRLHHLGEGVVVERQGELPRLHLGNIEDVVDQVEEMVPALLHPLQDLANLLGHLAVDVVHDELGIPQDGIHGGA